MNSYVFFIYEFICFMNSCMNSGVPRFRMCSVQGGALIGKNNGKGRFISCSRQLVAGGRWTYSVPRIRGTSSY